VSEVKRGRGRPALGDAAKRKVTIRLSPAVHEDMRADPRTPDDIMRAGLATRP